MFDQGGNTLLKGNQNGFYDLEGNPRPKLIEAVTEINHAVYEHSAHPADADDLQRLHEALFETWDLFQVKPRGKDNGKGKGKSR